MPIIGATNILDHNLEIFPGAFHLLSVVIVVVLVSLRRFFFTFAVRCSFGIFVFHFGFSIHSLFCVPFVMCRLSVDSMLHVFHRKRETLLLTVVTIAVAIYLVFGIKYKCCAR